MYFLVKTLISALIIATVTKLSESQTITAAFLKSLPLTSLLVFFFMKYEGRTDKEIAAMSWDILYLVIPSLILFIVLPLMLNRGHNFYISMATGVFAMSIGYFVTIKVIS
ncbi:DUF3147 family protein [Peredibacter starrii]|uniref:DUF3147 family protein n=1 Tax=Peredibacter starrii TaxID=28202 RepID=A0AAX4HJY0_9BACT|nr:DUF3147 family protein [Peredibacter starrii]WPU63535.1 DUF3147 family protein [Peredibacter starrii]